MRRYDEGRWKMDLRVPDDVKEAVEGWREAEAKRGVKITENRVVLHLIRLGLMTAKELGRLPNGFVWEVRDK